MQANAIVGGKLVSFKLSPELARAQRANAGQTMTDAEAVACVRAHLSFLQPPAQFLRSRRDT